MLTPAEELGLSGATLAGHVRKAFYKLSAAELTDLATKIREACVRRHVVYMRDGAIETVRVLPCPLTMLPDQLGYIQYASQTLHNALRRLPELYWDDPQVRTALRLSDVEEQWLRECTGPSQQESNPIFGRLDAVVDFSSPMWKDSLWFVEPNMSGIGGLHLTPMTDRIIEELVFPLLYAHSPGLALETGQDIRELLMQEIIDHLEAIGRKGRTVCCVEPRFADTGIDEQQDLADFYHERHGMTVFHADPSELTLRGSEVYYRDVAIDVVYRDYSVLDLLEREKQGVNIEPMKAMFKQNRVVSSIAAEIDQKACFEALTDPTITRRYFSAEERQVFRRHVLWTRRLGNRETMLPDGLPGNLLEYVREEREMLVLKPNRQYGGTGVLLGLAVSDQEWDKAITQALADTGSWVVQQLAGIPVYDFPVLDDAGGIHFEPFYVVMGFAPSKYGVAIMARASQKRVVNVAQRGGMCAVGIGYPPGPLIGPDRMG
jgi:hypothetical protein